MAGRSVPGGLVSTKPVVVAVVNDDRREQRALRDMLLQQRWWNIAYLVIMLATLGLAIACVVIVAGMRTDTSAGVQAINDGLLAAVQELGAGLAARLGARHV